MIARESVEFRGHPMVRSLHPTTIEVTTDDHLTPRGDCIIGVSAAWGCAQLSDRVKAALRTPGAKVIVRISAGPETWAFTATGDPGLGLSHPKEMVIRRSRFLSGRTLAVGASAAAKDVPRSLVARLQDRETVGRLEIEVR